MINTAIEMIGPENLETMALSWHKPIVGNYVIVNEDRHNFKVYNERKAEFNSKLSGLDYYSEIVHINKPIASKLITSNNIFTFFCRNTEKLTDEDIDKYYDKLELPEDKEWHRSFVKENIKGLGKMYSGIIKIFFPGTREDYRDAGIKNWWEKSISITKFDDTLGTPVGYVFNAKKSFFSNRFNTYLVDNQEGLKRKVFYDILKGMGRHGYDILYLWENRILPVRSQQGPPDVDIKGGIMFVFGFDKNGNVYIKDMDVVSNYTPTLQMPLSDIIVNNIRNIREERGLSRAELSRLSGVPLRTLENWENKVRTPHDIEQLKKIADVLNVTIDELCNPI